MLPESRKSNEEIYQQSAINRDRYSYKVFGLHIASEILLPELLIADLPDMPDVIIRMGKVPADISNAVETNEGFQAVRDHFLFHVIGVGRYYVANGNDIFIEPAEQAEAHSVRIFLLGTAFGALLLQRGILPIHGSTVVINGGCVIFTGVSGVGKSTLLAAFRERGYSFLTDDVAAVTLDSDGAAWVHAAYPQQKLWRDSMDNMGVDTAAFTPFFTGINKDKFAVPAQQGFRISPAPLAAVYELEAENRRDVILKPLSGIDKLAVLMRHTYRAWLIDRLEVKGPHFKQCVAVANQITVSRLSRPEEGFSQEEQVRLVQQDLARRLSGKAV